MIRHSSCPLCSSGRIAFFISCSDHFLTRESFDLFKCSDCDFVFTMEYPDEETIGSYYDSNQYISHDDSAGGTLNWLYMKARFLMLRKKRKLVEDASGLKRGNLLDIGCGTGYFASAMGKEGWKVSGIEPNRKAREFAAEKLGISVTEPRSMSKLPSSGFEVITMWHVLEHLHDPFIYASEIGRLLKPEGICLCAVPNRSSADAGYYGNSWAAYDVPRHLWHFSKASFELFASKSGFSLSGIKALPLDVFYISILSEKYRGSRFPYIPAVLKGTVFGFQSLLDIGKSSSLVFILRKK